MEDENGAAFSVIGTSDGNPYFSLIDTDGNPVSMEDGCYITSLAELTLGWHTGDTVTVYNPLSLEEYRFTVAGVFKNNVQKAVYTFKPLAAKLTGLDEGKFNAIVSGGKLSIPEAKIAQEVLCTDIIDQAKAMTGQMTFLLEIIIGLTSLCYFGSLWLLRLKVKKVDMIESLKDNRE